MTPVDPRFATRMRELLAERGMSYRRLAERAYQAKSHLHAIAHGVKTPTRDVAQRIDDALQAGGELVSYVGADQVTRESAELIELLCGGQPTDAVAAAARRADRLAVEYLSRPPATVLDEAAATRRHAMAILAHLQGPRRQPEATELLVVLGRLSGVLSYAALDIGDAAAARQHALAAWHCAETVDHHRLRAWVRGTQSLISRFDSDFPAALELARDGLRYARDGAGRARLLCGQGQSYANMGDADGARRALSAAAGAYEQAVNGERGLFGFSGAKLAYYSGSALIWLAEADDARRAEMDSQRAITLWQSGDPEDRAAGDEALAHVYLATARLQLGHLEGAEVALQPILNLPADRRLSWIRKRLARVNDEILAHKPYEGDAGARNLHEQINEF